MDEIAEALGRALGSFKELRVHDYIPDTVSVPAAFISFPDITYDADMDDDHLVTYRLHVIVSKVHDRAAYAALTPYLLPSGVKAAIEEDVTLGGTVSSVRVTAATVGPITISAVDYVGASFTAECYYQED